MMTWNVLVSIAILTLVMTILFMDAKLFLIQLVLFIGVNFIGTTMGPLIEGVQIVFGLYVLYQAKKAIDCNYILIMEKTHLIPRHYTKGGFIGGNFSLFNKRC